MKKYLKHPILFLLAGLFMGWLFFGGSGKEVMVDEHADHVQVSEEGTIWTCSMHPQIQLPDPGDCPICAMELIPMAANAGSSSPFVINMSSEEIKLAGIKTVTARNDHIKRSIFMQGRAEVDRNSMNNQTVHFGGRVEKLYVNFAGQQLKKGEKVATIYSPDLIKAQQELLEALKLKDVSPKLYTASRKKLNLLNLSDTDINEIESSGRVKEYLDLYADFDGFVLTVNVHNGDYVKKGQAIFTYYDINKIWLEFDLFDRDIPFVKKGSTIRISIKGAEINKQEAVVDFVSLEADPVSGSVMVRATVRNKKHAIKPGMYAEAIADVKTATKLLIIPKAAIMWTGKRSVAYVRIDTTSFEMREVEIGQESGEFYSIKSGLQEGEEIVSKATFTLDAAAQLQGKMSMMNRETVEKKDMMIMNKEALQIINNMLFHYVKMKDFFVKSDPVAAAKEAANLSDVPAVVKESFSSDSQEQLFLEKMHIIKKAASDITKETDLEKQRAAFQLVSDAIIELVKKAHTGKTIYVQYCPMAFGDKGAYWLSKEKEIMNPYFGDMMLRCGEVKLEIKP